jgi:hypothetical protein
MKTQAEVEQELSELLAVLNDDQRDTDGDEIVAASAGALCWVLGVNPWDAKEAE